MMPTRYIRRVLFLSGKSLRHGLLLSAIFIIFLIIEFNRSVYIWVDYKYSEEMFGINQIFYAEEEFDFTEKRSQGASIISTNGGGINIILRMKSS